MNEQHPMFAKSTKAEAPVAQQDESNPTSNSDKHLLAIAHLEVAGPFGLTYPELGEKEHWGHGQVSSVLSNLHRDGLAVRLTEKRQSRCSVYVLTKYAEGRRVIEFKGNKASQVLKDASLKDERILELEKELEVWKTRNNTTSHGDLALQSEVDRLQAQVEVLVANQRETEEKLAQSERDKVRMQSRLTETETLLDETFGKMDGLGKNLNEANGKIKAFSVELDRIKKAYGAEQYEVDQILGKALGYPEGYPDVNDVDDGSVETGPQTLPSLAEEAAAKIKSLSDLLRTKEEIPAPKIPTISAEEEQFLGKVKRAIQGKPDTAVQPTRAGSLRALVGFAERMPRA